MPDTDMILSRQKFNDLERKLFGALELLRGARPYVGDVANDLGDNSESDRLLASIDEFLERV